VTPPSLVLDTVTRVAFHTICAFSLYLLFAGHNAPGGGFVGGLVAGAALVLRYAGRGTHSVREVVRVRHEALLGVGLLLAGLTGAAPWLLGGVFLGSGVLEAALPLLGTVKLASVLVFDAGVYLVVVGLVLAAVSTLGDEPEQP
jgi:multicomponent Na+:H+ antiporter subunit A